MSVLSKKTRIRFTLTEKLFICILTFLSINYVVKYYVGKGLYAGYVYAFSAAFIVLGLIVSKLDFNFRNIYELFLLLVFISCIIVTFLHLGSDNATGGKLESIFIYSGIFTAFLYRKTDIRAFGRLFCVTGIISVILFLFVLSRTNINIVSAIGRGYQWTEIFYYCPAFCFAPAFLIYSIIQRKNILLSVIVFLADVVLHLIVVKRIILLEIASLFVVLIILGFSGKARLKTVVKLLIIAVVLIAVLLYFYGDTLLALYDSVFNRTIEVADSENMTAFDRFYESGIYFGSASILDIIFGRGFSGSHTSLGVGASALHVGWSNFILKGGIFLFLLAVIPYVKCFKLLLNFKKQSFKKQFAVLYMLYMLPMLFISNMHGFEPNIFLFFFCCIEVMNKERTESVLQE